MLLLVTDWPVLHTERSAGRTAVAAEATERDEEGRAEASSGGGGHAASGTDDSTDAASSLLGDGRHRSPRQAARDAGKHRSKTT